MREVISYTRFAVIANVACILLAQGESRKHNITCSGNIYRSADGQCNNLWHPEWGSSNREFSRLLLPMDEDNLEQLPPTEYVSQKIASYLRRQTLSYLPRTSVFHMWTELLNLDLNLPSETNPTENEATSYLDASFLYNPSESVNFTETLENGDLAFHLCKNCQSVSPHGISSINLLALEHNRVADIVRKMNPHWDGQTVFEESRRVIIAEIQHITYTQYLPLLIGDTFYPKVDSNTRLNAQSNYNYDKELPVEIYFSFVDVLMKALKKNYIKSFEESNSFSTKNLLQYSKQAIPDFPSYLNREDIDEMLLVSRQHKLRPYADWIEFCKNNPTTSASYYSSLSRENQNVLNDIYEKTSHVELVAGALTEKVLSNGIVGETMSCLATIQFTNVKNGDRHWYTRKNHRHSFSAAQLRELMEQVMMSGLVCANANQHFIQKNAFLVHDLSLNEAVTCSSLPSFSLINWNKNRNIDRLKKEQIIKEAIRRAEDDLDRRRQTEFLLWSQKGGVDPKSPIGTAAAFSKPNKNALLLANNSILLEYASKELQNIFNEKFKSKRLKRQTHDSDDPSITISDEGNFLQEIDISSIIPDVSRELENSCPAEIAACDPSYPYRSFTGYCNNLRKPNWGKSLTTFSRILPPAYDNGISKPRYKSVMGIPLPSARLISSMMHLDVSNLDSKHSMMLMQFAQFLDHDITFTPVQKGFFASIPDCRPCDSPRTVHPECMPIEVPAGDPYYPQVNFSTGQRFCLPFMRSLPGQQRLGARDQINQNSAFLDLSQVYGDNACLARQLRAYQGRLNTTISLYGDKELLPQSPTHPECKATSGYCFIAGDGRASEQPGLTSIHTLFMREHNRMADSLRSLNPHWEDERLYQQARKIFTGQYQHIIYNEFLPRLLGLNAMNVYGMNLEPPTQYFTGYTNDCNPSALTEFASAAFRIGHSLLRPFMPRMSSSYQPLDPPILLRDTFFNPDIIYQVIIINYV
ncbi:hypothetical protein V9T40_010643 [Parthenolecanium corni]|uniref:Peroxidase n=1 Tax=Parthenolecanium corni TaxID=536013 RepID=A0AAN9T3X1_9HEMI